MIIPEEIYKIKAILDSFLGESKSDDLSSDLQIEYPCPRCGEKYGFSENSKFNLSISLSKMKFQCWKCSSEDDSDMKGSLSKLIKLYGNEELYKEYKSLIKSLKESKLYNINLFKNLHIDTESIKDDMELPEGYQLFTYGKPYSVEALKYLNDRNIKWDIINKFHIGYTTYNKDKKILSNRIIIPSYNAFGDLNYWTGRDYTEKNKRQKYFNPKVERKNIIFNEDKIQWNADITLVEGPFDHIVTPNSIPLLGKHLDAGFDIYWKLLAKAKANINIFLDGDAFETIKETYIFLNHDKLYDRIRYIPSEKNEDPSSIYQKEGERGIINHLRNYKKL